MRFSSRFSRAILAAFVISLPAALLAADAPRVVETFPPNGATDVNAAITELRVTFDQDMSPAGYSWVGGGARYPKTNGKPRWLSSRTCAMSVSLQANHDYELWINSDRFTNFRSVSGVGAKWIHWTFKTGAAREVDKPLPPRVTALSPENGAEIAPGQGELKVTFDRPMRSGVSFMGGGETFPTIVGDRTWIDAETVVVPVAFFPGRSYEIGLNGPGHANFQSVEGAALEPVAWTFETSGEPLKGDDEARFINEISWDQLENLIDERYSYRDLRGVDWAKRFAEYRDRAAAATGSAAFAKVAAEALAPSEDLHIHLRYEGGAACPAKRSLAPDWNDRAILAAFPNARAINKTLAVGTSADGIGYLSVSSLSRRNEADFKAVDETMASLKNCRAIILDIRANSGGAEPLARTVAGWFTDERVLYAKHVYRDSRAAGGFGRLHERYLEPAGEGKLYARPVYALVGKHNMSSADAFVLMLKACPNVTAVGAPTFGSSGNPREYKLTNGVSVNLPSWKAMRPDGTSFEGEGIQPDVLVNPGPAAFKTADPVLEKALELARKAEN